MKKILFIFASVLMFTSCGSNVIESYTSIYEEAREKLAEVNTEAELDMLKYEVKMQKFEVYSSNPEKCDVLAEELARYLRDKDNMTINEEDKEALVNYAAVRAAFDKELKNKEKEILKDKNKTAKDYNNFMISLHQGRPNVK